MTIWALCGSCGNRVEQGQTAPRDMRESWNDGYSAAISNALDAGLITEDQADELLTELSRFEN